MESHTKKTLRNQRRKLSRKLRPLIDENKCRIPGGVQKWQVDRRFEYGVLLAQNPDKYWQLARSLVRTLHAKDGIHNRIDRDSATSYDLLLNSLVSKVRILYATGTPRIDCTISNDMVNTRNAHSLSELLRGDLKCEFIDFEFRTWPQRMNLGLVRLRVDFNPKFGHTSFRP